MIEAAVYWSWLEFAVRWLHVITAMAWIGASFYFIALDLMLKPAPGMPKGAHGEEWEVHGGGFYHTTKYLVAPDRLPEHLTWHKWQSYWTWLSGAALLAIIYWVGGEIYLLDPGKADLALWQGILISAGSIGIGWVLYDFLCKSKLGDHPTAMMVTLFVIIVLMSWGLNQVFTGRAALLHLGAFTATIMTANVFFIIMPNQRIVVADLKAGRTPDAKYGKIAKLRSMHNNYLTLPVVFLMLSNHYPLSFGTEYAWVIASLIFLTGVTIRHYFNTMHATGVGPHWTWLITIVLFLIICGLSMAPFWKEEKELVLNQRQQAIVADAGFEPVREIVLSKCAMCHAEVPGYEGFQWAPKGVRLDTDAYIVQHAKDIYLQAGVSKAMPPPNANWITQEERMALREWYEGLNS